MLTGVLFQFRLCLMPRGAVSGSEFANTAGRLPKLALAKPIGVDNDSVWRIDVAVLCARGVSLDRRLCLLCPDAFLGCQFAIVAGLAF